MRDDATFIGIEVDDDAAQDAELARKLEEACPVGIYSSAEGRVAVVHENVDECILCGLCLHPRPGAVQVHKLYSGEELVAG